MKNIKLKNIIMLLSGILILGTGIGMMAKVGIGTDSLSATYVGVSNLANISLGSATVLINLLMMIIAFFLYRKNIGIGTILFILVSKWPVDFGQKYMVTSNNLFISILLCIICVAIIALGSELFILSDLGACSYDALTMSVGKLLKHEVKYIYIRYCFDTLFLIIALIIKGQIGIGTIISLALVGIFMKMWQKILVKVLKLETNSKLN